MNWRHSTAWGFFPQGRRRLLDLLPFFERNRLNGAMHDCVVLPDIQEVYRRSKRQRGNAGRSGEWWGNTGSGVVADSCVGGSRGSARVTLRTSGMLESKICVFQNITPLSEA